MTNQRKVAGLVMAALVSVLGCTEESVTAVDIAQVSVTPPSISTVEGGRIQFVATVRAEGEELLDAEDITWSTDDARVLVVDGRGEARALRRGAARVYASFRGVQGEARVVVVPRPGGGLLDVLLDELVGG